jgi:beta-1,4-mannosyltransferase
MPDHEVPPAGPSPGRSPVLKVLAAPASVPADDNPYITSLYSAVRARGVQVDEFDRRALLSGRYDIVHVHWPEELVGWGWTDVRSTVAEAAKTLVALTVARRRGARLVWKGHDLGPHDVAHPRIYRAYITRFVRMVDLLISLGPSATRSLQDTYPGLRATPVRTVRHGHYRGIYPPLPNPVAARAELGLPADPPLFLLLGQIRRYKNVPALIHAFNRTRPQNAHLAVAGEVKADATLGQQVEAAAAGSAAVTVRIGLVPEAQISTWHAAASVVVLPYSLKTSLHSGAALLALSMDRPVVVPNSGTMRELRDLAGPEWVYLFDGGPEEALAAAEKALVDDRPQTVDLSALDWPALGAQTLQAYQLAVRSKGRSRQR